MQKADTIVHHTQSQSMRCLSFFLPSTHNFLSPQPSEFIHFLSLNFQYLLFHIYFLVLLKKTRICNKENDKKEKDIDLHGNLNGEKKTKEDDKSIIFNLSTRLKFYGY